MTQQRRMASMEAIEAYWLPDDNRDRLIETDNIFWLDGFCFLSCFGCGGGSTSTGPRTDLVRGHLVDHARGGSGEVDNLVPLCDRCNTDMPSFGPGERDYAIAWLRSREAECNWYMRTINNIVNALHPEDPITEQTIDYVTKALGWTRKVHSEQEQAA